MMRIVVSGGSGFLGRPLCRALRDSGHRVIVLTRRLRQEGDLAWSPDFASGAWVAAVHAADVVINLAGEGIADRRWSAARKAAILQSRVTATRALAAALRDAVRPAVFLSGSAIGIYGNRGDESLAEDTPAGTDFLAQVCVEWEREATSLGDITRVVLLRTGIVLARDGGALPRMAFPFRLFAGGALGSGRQFMSWIHRDDWIAMTMWAMSASIRGPINLTAPAPVDNADFARTLGRVLHRPSALPVPAFVLRLALGELADTALLGSQRAVPQRALANGFGFRYPDLGEALRAIYSR
ncbi:MAG TPA: TIGR01777 family oxidoreductase [Vicinamibacterales bacterium]|jgi:uncharacterized protein (TIGR01777 family)|nr:TIGR01777 family oxidoreductase [Vicinamibacterales bacterium]